MTRVKGNGANIKDINYAETEALRQVFSIVHYLQRNGFETYALSHVANQVGVRETNQIQGLYTLTEQDVVEGRRFQDVVAQTNYEIDIHSPDGKRRPTSAKSAATISRIAAWCPKRWRICSSRAVPYPLRM